MSEKGGKQNYKEKWMKEKKKKPEKKIAIKEWKGKERKI